MSDHENQLRGLLQAAVPDDASSLDPQAVSTAARRARHRNRLVVLGASAATVVLVGVVGVIATSGPDKDRAAENPTTTAPYDAPACPATLPELNDANMTVDSLDGLTSVRLCPDLEGTGNPPLSAADQRAILDGLDALVEDLDGFRRAATAVPEPDPARCAAISVMNNRQSLQFTIGDRTVLVATPVCNTVTLEDHQIDGGDLANVFLTALAQQREDLTYRRDYTAPLNCDQAGFPTPASPGREHLVAAVHCAPTGESTPLDEDQLAALDAAWQNPGDIAVDLNESGGNNCIDPVDVPSMLLVATDHGDVTQLTDSPCGWLYWNGWDGWLDQQAAIPTTLKDLGLG